MDTKKYPGITSMILWICFFTGIANAQSLDFQNAIYFTATGNNLATSDQTLSAFNFSSASASHPIFNDGLYYPVKDFQGKNLWVRVRHIAADPNGTTIGHTISSTSSSPFRSGGFGGWGGFMYQFDIFRDVNLTGSPGNVLNGIFRATIQVESIETLSDSEWVYFEILDNSNSAWVLNSINFTGANPASNPRFSGDMVPYNNTDAYSPDFPITSNKVSVLDSPGGGFSEFVITANSVTRFLYGYEYNAGGYQGMRLTFGAAPLEPTLIGFTPTTDEPGAIVVITGTNFDPTPENNIVTFGGVPATVTASTTTTITVVVPVNAITGKISVTSNGTTIESTELFTVIPIIIPIGELAIYNAVSPNADGKNDFFLLENIELADDTRNNKVVIYNRWGDEVYRVENYDNDIRVFRGLSLDGNKLPPGTYFYRIEMPDANKKITGFIELKY